jgi:hypothetical protein
MIDRNGDEIFHNNNGIRTILVQKELINLEELKVQVYDNLRRYETNCLRHVTRMKSNRMLKTMPNYRPYLGIPWKRLLEEAHTSLLRHNT